MVNDYIRRHERSLAIMRGEIEDTAPEDVKLKMNWREAANRHNRALIADKKAGLPDISYNERLARQRLWAERKRKLKKGE